MITCMGFKFEDLVSQTQAVQSADADSSKLSSVNQHNV